MNAAAARRWLDAEWEKALENPSETPDPEIDRFINSTTVSIRYAFVTQLLGKVADPTRNLLSLQAGKKGDDGAYAPGAWNARSFSTEVVVPWVADNHNVLGASAEPYAGKPLRRPRLTPDMPDVKNRTEWRNLAIFFESLAEADPDEIQGVFRRCLQSLARRLKKQKFQYPLPRRVSMERLSNMLDAFLGEASQGLRPLVVSAALMRVLGKAFSLFSDVQAQGLNEADTASGMPGDIMCYGISSGKVALVIEVKDHNLRLLDLRASITKVRQSGDKLSSLLFAVPGIREHDREQIETRIEHEWASGLNVYHLDVLTLARTAFTLLDENSRVEFLERVGEELDSRGEHKHREAWRSLLAGDD